jgi:hypothetical protein
MYVLLFNTAFPTARLYNIEYDGDGHSLLENTIKTFSQRDYQPSSNKDYQNSLHHYHGTNLPNMMMFIMLFNYDVLTALFVY